ncbi:hypothetical protein FRC17_002621 [Serendipita sp. 399]|nr:hypothetical protein FRC17_002621 [Serendipita sp. 399]
MTCSVTPYNTPFTVARPPYMDPPNGYGNQHLHHPSAPYHNQNGSLPFVDGFPLRPKVHGFPHHVMTLSGPQLAPRENRVDIAPAYVDRAHNTAWQTNHSVHPLVRLPTTSRGSGGLEQPLQVECSSPPHPRHPWSSAIGPSSSNWALQHRRQHSLQEGIVLHSAPRGTRARQDSNESRPQARSDRRFSMQSPTDAPKTARHSPPKGAQDSDISALSSSPPSSPTPPFVSALSPVHVSYRGLSRTESGLIPIPINYQFKRGEIVMTRTTRRLMKTSNSSRLTARHPCLVLQTSATHVHPVGALLQHWLAREDESHRDVFGRQGLRTSPPSERAGYIWVGDGGEWVPIENVKYLTGTQVEEAETRRLEILIDYHMAQCPFRLQPGPL